MAVGATNASPVWGGRTVLVTGAAGLLGRLGLRSTPRRRRHGPGPGQGLGWRASRSRRDPGSSGSTATSETRCCWPSSWATAGSTPSSIWPPRPSSARPSTTRSTRSATTSRARGGSWKRVATPPASGGSWWLRLTRRTATRAAGPIEKTCRCGRSIPTTPPRRSRTMLARTYAHTYALPVAVTRCGNLYGGGDLNWSRIVPGTVRSVLEGEAPIIRSDGTFVRDYLYVRDAADGVLALAELMGSRPDLAGTAVNFAAGNRLSVVEIVRRILRLMGSNLEPVDPRLAAQGDPRTAGFGEARPHACSAGVPRRPSTPACARRSIGIEPIWPRAWPDERFSGSVALPRLRPTGPGRRAGSRRDAARQRHPERGGPGAAGAPIPAGPGLLPRLLARPDHPHRPAGAALPRVHVLLVRVGRVRRAFPPDRRAADRAAESGWPEPGRGAGQQRRLPAPALRPGRRPRARHRPRPQHRGSGHVPRRPDARGVLHPRPGPRARGRRTERGRGPRQQRHRPRPGHQRLRGGHRGSPAAGRAGGRRDAVPPRTDRRGSSSTRSTTSTSSTTRSRPLAACSSATASTVVDVERIPVHGGSLRVYAMRADAGAKPTAAVRALLDEEEAVGLCSAAYYSSFGAGVLALGEALRGESARPDCPRATPWRPTAPRPRARSCSTPSASART